MTGDQEPPASTGGNPLKDNPLIILVTFVIAVVGAVTGTLSFVQARQVAVFATAAYGDNQKPGSLQVSIVNNSQRGISFTGADLYFQDKLVAHVDQWLDGVPDPTDPRDAFDVFKRAQRVPVAVPPGSSIVGTAVFTNPFGNERGDERLYQILLGGGRPDIDPTADAQLALRLDFQPEHQITIDVAPPPAGGVPERIPTSGFAAGWGGFYVFKAGTANVKSLMLDGSNRRPGIGRLALYRPAASRPFLSRERPVTPSQWVIYRLPALPAATYYFAYSFNGKTVGAGSFVQPCPKQYFARHHDDFPPKGLVELDACQPQ